MKNIFLSFLVLSLSQLARGDGGGSCHGNFISFDPEILLYSNCSNLPEGDVSSSRKDNGQWGKLSKTCICLSNQVKTNVLLKSISESVKIPDGEALEAGKQKYRETFFNMYEKMTVGASVQAQIFGLNNDLDQDISTKEKIVGCTPSDVSSQVSVKAIKSLEIQYKELTKLKKDIDSKLAECTNTEVCDQLRITAERVAKNLINAKNPDVGCTSAINMLLDKIKKMSPNGSLSDFISSIPPSEQDFFTGLQKVISENKFHDFLNTSSLLNSTLSSGLGKHLTCAGIHEIVSSKFDAYKKKNNALLAQEASATIAEAAGDSPSQCETTDKLCLEFEKKNQEILKITQDKYSAKSEECITQAEFDTFKAMPSDALLAAFAATKPRHLGRLLELPKNVSQMTDVEEGTTNFLRSNPIIAKMALDKDSRGELGKKLKILANSINSKEGKAGKYKAYLEFMKNDVKKMVGSNQETMKSSESFVCSNIASSFTAIEIANDLPAEVEQDDGDETSVGKLLKEFKKCDRLHFQESSTTDLAATLNQNPIFNLGVTDPESNAEKKEFNDLKAELCGGYPDFVAKQCDKDANDACRMKYLAKQRSGGKLPETVDQAAQAAIDAKESNSIKSNLDDDDMNDVSRYTDPTQQDQPYKDWWNDNVGSQMNQNVMSGPGNHDDFEKSQRKNESIAFSTKAPESLFSPKDPVAHNNSTPNLRDSQASFSGQQIPKYANEVSPFDVNKLASATSAKDMIENYDNLAPNNKKQSLNEFKQFNATQPDSPVSQESIDQEIAKVSANPRENKDVEEREKKSKAPSEIASPGAPSIVRAGQNFSNQNNVAPVTQASLNSPTTSSAASAKIDAKSLAAKATNEALLKANEFKNESNAPATQGRSPASLSADSDINFQRGLLDPSLLKADLRVDVLKAPSHKEYLLIKENLVVLKTFLARKIDANDLNEPKIVKILDPQVSPVSYLRFYVSKGSNGSIDVITLDRKFRLDTLKYGLPNL